MINNMNEYSFLRKILVSDSSEILLKAYKSLSNEGLEVYVKDLDNNIKLFNEKKMGTGNLLMVPASDWDFALEILISVGLEKYLTKCEPLTDGKSDLEVAQQEFLKKRKWTYIETAVIIIIAMLYYISKSFIR